MKQILCLDFDGVIHSYMSDWQGADVIPDAPTPGALQFLADATIYFDVCIFSSRSNQEGGIEAMKEWLRKEYLKTKFSEAEQDSILSKLRFPLEKPPALVTLDDRAIQFTGLFPSITTLLHFKPWNR